MEIEKEKSWTVHHGFLICPTFLTPTANYNYTYSFLKNEYLIYISVVTDVRFLPRKVAEGVVFFFYTVGGRSPFLQPPTSFRIKPDVKHVVWNDGIHQSASYLHPLTAPCYWPISSLFEPVINLNSVLSAVSACLVYATVKGYYWCNCCDKSVMAILFVPLEFSLGKMYVAALLPKLLFKDRFCHFTCAKLLYSWVPLT